MTANVHQQNARMEKKKEEKKKKTMICYTKPIHGLYQLVQDGGQINVIFVLTHMWLAKRITLKDAWDVLSVEIMWIEKDYIVVAPFWLNVISHFTNSTAVALGVKSKGLKRIFISSWAVGFLW